MGLAVGLPCVAAAAFRCSSWSWSARRARLASLRCVSLPESSVGQVARGRGRAASCLGTPGVVVFWSNQRVLAASVAFWPVIQAPKEAAASIIS